MTLLPRLLLALALFTLPVRAQTPATPEARALATQFMAKMQVDQMAPQLIGATRLGVIAMLQQNAHVTEAQAGEAFDKYIEPEFKQRIPELIARFTDILVADFTVPELRAIVDNEQNDARRSAAVKAQQLPQQFSQTGQEWGQQVGTDAFTKNKDAFKALGFDVGAVK